MLRMAKYVSFYQSNMAQVAIGNKSHTGPVKTSYDTVYC